MVECHRCQIVLVKRWISPSLTGYGYVWAGAGSLQCATVATVYVPCDVYPIVGYCYSCLMYDFSVLYPGLNPFATPKTSQRFLHLLHITVLESKTSIDYCSSQPVSRTGVCRHDVFA